MAFYNTSSEQGETLKHAQSETKKQDQEVFDTLKQSGATMTARDIHKVLNDMCVPERILLTSVRRSLTDLCEEGKIEAVTDKDGEPIKIIGVHGRKVFQYRMPQPKGQMKMFN
jgi:Fe2+ or Zn2+ uptake regulation protein